MGTLSAPATTQAYSLTTWSWNEPVKLQLVDGREIEGRFRGVLGRTSDPGTHVARYAKWRSKLGASAAPALGDTLLVTRASGEPVRGALRGFADKVLLLGTEDSCRCLVLPLNELTEVRLDGGHGQDARAFANLKRWKSAPSLYSVALESEGGEIAVPVTMVASREMLPRPGNRTTSVTVGLLVCAVLVVTAAAAAVASSFMQPML
jgi:hypothetical protein